MQTERRIVNPLENDRLRRRGSVTASLDNAVGFPELFCTIPTMASS